MAENIKTTSSEMRHRVVWFARDLLPYSNLRVETVGSSEMFVPIEFTVSQPRAQSA